MNGVPSKEQRGGWVEGSNSNKREKSGRAIQSKPEGKPLGNKTNAYAQCDHLLANRKSPSNYDYL